MSPSKSPQLTGISVRHQKSCRTQTTGGSCDCTRSYRGEVHNPATGRPVKSRWYKSAAEARGWRVSKQNAIRSGALSPSSTPTLREAALEWLAKAQAGEYRNRSGHVYKPAVIRSYEASLRLHVLPTLGDRKLANIRRADIQELVDRMGVEGRKASTVRNAINPIRKVFRRAAVHELVATNPTVGLELPALDGERNRVADPEEGRSLLNALPSGDRAIWATAMYAGLRLGELLALSWEDVDLQQSLIYVNWSWDSKAGRVRPKSRAGQRKVPIPAVLRPHLDAQRGVVPWQRGLVFGRAADTPFSQSGVRNRAYRTWDAAGLEPIGFHECRHTYATLMIAANVNAKTLSTFMGHSSITVTLDRYGHLFPGSESEAAELLDAFLEAELS